VYAVIDLETTGLRPNRRDRVVELAVVHLDSTGKVEQEWSTLVNPGCDLGPQRVHGIRAADVLDAPSFQEIAGILRSLLTGRILVAHNLWFDAMFLQAEYDRLGVTVPVGPELGLCTMQLAPLYLPAAGRSLRDCCAHAGIHIDRPHQALDDARAAAGLLRYYLDRAGTPPPWQDRLEAAARTPWPPLPTVPVVPVQRRSGAEAPHAWLSSLGAQLPRVGSEQEEAYLALLDRALLDRHLSVTETRELQEFAARVGLGRAQARELHRNYLATLAAEARASGAVTHAEYVELVEVACQLGLTAADLDRALAAEQPAIRRNRFTLAPGDEVVFTGQSDEPREVWEERARAAGLTVGVAVTKRRTRLVVAADPDSLSTKARLARRYGIPIVDFVTLVRLMAEMPERVSPPLRGTEYSPA